MSLKESNKMITYYTTNMIDMIDDKLKEHQYIFLKIYFIFISTQCFVGLQWTTYKQTFSVIDSDSKFDKNTKSTFKVFDGNLVHIFHTEKCSLSFKCLYSSKAL